MYQSFYNLSEDPFRLTPCTQGYYEHRTFSKVRAYIVYALQRCEGILVITGAPGLGKTTLVRSCVQNAAVENVTFCEVSAAHLTVDDFLYIVANRFGIDCEGLSTGRILIRLESQLASLMDAGRRAVLLVDEAQDLDIASMDEIKALSNLEYHGRPLLQLFLVGQNSLVPYLRKPELEALLQRVSAACLLKPMTQTEVGEYIQHRLTSCGWKDDPVLDTSVTEVVFQHSGGIPRRVNLICSRLLLRGMIKGSHELNGLDVKLVLDELYREGLAIAPGQLDDSRSALKEAYQ